MRYLLFVHLLLTLLLPLGCKKEGDVNAPDVLDYSGKYYVQGKLESNLGIGQRDLSIKTGVDAASDSVCELITEYTGPDNYLTISALLQENVRYRRFLTMFYGDSKSNLFDARWTAGALDSLFQPGKKLLFGNDSGKVKMELADQYTLSTVTTYVTKPMENAGTYVLIEQVEDVSNKYPEPTQSASVWAKIITFSFTCRLSAADGTSSEVLTLKEGRASVLLKVVL